MGVRRKFRRHSDAITRTPRWKALRVEVLRRDDFKCRSCGARGRLEVDHIVPVRDAPDRAYDMTNLQALCAACHARKTREEVGLASRANAARTAWRKAVRQLERPSHRAERTCDA